MGSSCGIVQTFFTAFPETLRDGYFICFPNDLVRQIHNCLLIDCITVKIMMGPDHLADFRVSQCCQPIRTHNCVILLGSGNVMQERRRCDDLQIKHCAGLPELICNFQRLTTDRFTVPDDPLRQLGSMEQRKTHCFIQ